MKISLDWLSDYVEIESGPERVAEVLSEVGFACEGMETHGDDTVIDLEVTSNRGDCLGHIGIARELAAATGKALRLPVVELEESQRDVGELASVEIEAPELCGRYTARIVEGVSIGPGPGWMARRLEAVGMRSVNNVVDATNYAMMETGQPPHAFDYAKIADGRIIVRRARRGERLVSIDQTKCDLSEQMLVIADARGPVAVAGVMGGLDTEVSDRTSSILLEDAHFEAVSIRATSRALGLSSEAAFRFERGIDIEAVEWASRRTCQLIAQVAGGKVARGVVDVYPGRPAAKEVRLRLGRLKLLLGVEIAAEEVARILEVLGFGPRVEGEVVVCSVPSWRGDVYREVDLIEEVARHHGYDKIPTKRRIEIEVAGVDRRQRIGETVSRYLNACGYYETVNVTFVDSVTAGLFGVDKDKGHLAVKDESRKSANLLRKTLIGSLLGVLKTNLNAKNRPCRVFEIAAAFLPVGEEGALPVEETRVGLVCDGQLRELGGVVEGLLRSINRQAEVRVVPAELAWAETGGEVVVDGEAVGVLGTVGEAVRRRFDFEGLIPCAAELSFDKLLALVDEEITVKPIPRFPAIERDLSVIVDEAVRWSQIIEAVRAEAAPELEQVRFVGIYRGKGIPAGRKSVTLSLRFRDEDGTLRHEAVDEFERAIVASLERQVKGQLRTV